MLETLEHLEEIEINNYLCKEIKAHFNLDKMPEDMISSYYVFNIKNKELSNEDLEDSFKEKIKSLTKCIVIINYKFQNLDKCSLKGHIDEFIKHF
jgi:hypothetical protein